MEKEIIEQYITEHKKQMLETLCELIETPSSDGKDTLAQSVVVNRLKQLGYSIDVFKEDERVRECIDYCDPGFSYSDNTYNVAGFLKGNNPEKSLMLFGHIDTESEDYFGEFKDPYKCEIKDGKIIGLGASDDKGGIAMILEALRVLQHLKGKPDYDLTVLSLLGKHGGAFGTLSAMMKGYTAGHSLYVHPAETGHGFQEIKNISLGILDLTLTVYGKSGILHDDLSAGENANLKMAKAISILEEYNRKKREECLFDFGFFKGKPSFLLNIGSIGSDGSFGTVCEKAECHFRCRFFFPDSVDLIYRQINDLLKERLEGKWELKRGNFIAEPAIVENDDPFVKYIENCIETIEGKKDFIHQYHGGSDIRFPILYGNSKCVGIGPYCALPEKGSGVMEWLDEKDYFRGIEILSLILLNY